MDPIVVFVADSGLWVVGCGLWVVCRNGLCVV